MGIHSRGAFQGRQPIQGFTVRSIFKTRRNNKQYLLGGDKLLANSHIGIKCSSKPVNLPKPKGQTSSEEDRFIKCNQGKSKIAALIANAGVIFRSLKDSNNNLEVNEVSVCGYGDNAVKVIYHTTDGQSSEGYYCC